MKISADQFSSHLFWDINRSKLNFEMNKDYVIHQVLEYGLLNDWNLVKNHYGMKTIVEIALNARELDLVTLSFISAISNIPKEKFKCYTYQQSIPPHWNF